MSVGYGMPPNKGKDSLPPQPANIVPPSPMVPHDVEVMLDLDDPRWGIAISLYFDLVDLDARFEEVRGRWSGMYAAETELIRELREKRQELSDVESFLYAQISQDDPRCSGGAVKEREAKRKALVESDERYVQVAHDVNLAETKLEHAQLEKALAEKELSGLDRRMNWRRTMVGFFSTVRANAQPRRYQVNVNGKTIEPVSLDDVPEIPFVSPAETREPIPGGEEGPDVPF